MYHYIVLKQSNGRKNTIPLKFVRSLIWIKITGWRLRRAIRHRHFLMLPYSHFQVGAGITWMMAVYWGLNQENASYPLCMCAERVALYHLSSFQAWW